MRTQTQLAVRPAEPMTVAAFERRFARPLLAFTVLAADRPDAITHEAVSDAKRCERAVILRMGRSVTPREWRPDDRFLFRAEQIDDVADIYGRWMALWEEAGPEVATFVDAVNEGSTYSRARLLASVVALEAYWRTALRGLADAIGADAAVKTVRSARVARGEPRPLDQDEWPRLLRIARSPHPPGQA